MFIEECSLLNILQWKNKTYAIKRTLKGARRFFPVRAPKLMFVTTALLTKPNLGSYKHMIIKRYELF